MNILAIDTSTEACSAALLREDGQLFSEFEVAPRQHTRLLPKMMNSVLASANCSKSSISYCAFANGPGAFTGIRIAASTAQGIGIALNIPLVQISTLATLAQVSLDRHDGDSTLVALDARMGEVYWAVYRRDDNGLADIVGLERLDKVNDVAISSFVGFGAGHGWLVGRDVWKQEQSMMVDTELLPNARALVKLAEQAVSNRQFCAADRITINYLRNQGADKSKKT